MIIKTNCISLTFAQIARLKGDRIARHLKSIEAGDVIELDVVATGADTYTVAPGSRHRLMACNLAGLARVPVRVVSAP